MEVKIEQSWKERLQNEFDKPYFEQLTQFVRSEYQTQTIYPPAGLIFNAFVIFCAFKPPAKKIGLLVSGINE